MVLMSVTTLMKAFVLRMTEETTLNMMRTEFSTPGIKESVLPNSASPPERTLVFEKNKRRRRIFRTD